jgi:hypothetical protein
MTQTGALLLILFIVGPPAVALAWDHGRRLYHHLKGE